MLVPPIHARFPTHATLVFAHNHRFSFYGPITLSGAAFQQTIELESVGWPQNIHISTLFPIWIRFALRRVRSPLLTASRLISFPSGTKMLQFPEFPLPYGSVKRKSHSVIVGSTAPCTYPTHIAAWHDLRRRPSRAIPQVVLQLRTDLLKR